MRSIRRIASLCICATLAVARAHSQTQLQLPSGLAYDGAGNLYFTDTNRNQVLEATLGGMLTIVAGTGTQGFAGDGGPALAAQLSAPQGIAIGPDGTLYIADTGNHRIRQITGGQITTIAGTGRAGFSGDGAAATAALFRSPAALAIDPTGALLICDTGNHRVRRIASGTVTTVAGNGRQGFSGDGGPATSAQLDTPLGVAAFAGGAFYIADARNDRIRSVGLDGTIHTMAGAGFRGFAGDGGVAIQAKLALPHGLLITSAGLVLTDTANQRLRLIDSSGMITTLAGNGTEGRPSDGDTALAATIDTPAGAAISPLGRVSFADSANHAVRLIADGQLFVPAALAPTRTSTLAAGPVSSQIYGAAAWSVSVSGSAGTPQGTVQLLDGSQSIASGTLAGGTTTVSLTGLTGGSHTLTAAYLGDVLNPAAKLSTNVTILPAPSVTIETLPAGSAYVGMPLTLTAQVSSMTTGMPGGVVQFLEGTTPVASAQLVAGSATGVYLNPTLGTHPIQAVYSGDGNFQSSSSGAAKILVQAMPDFVVTSSAASQTVQGGTIAIFPITVASQTGDFSGLVTMSATGLPGGATVSFSPAQVVPGTGSATLQMSVTTAVRVVHSNSFRVAPLLAALFVAFPLLWRRRCVLSRAALWCCLSASAAACLACGSRTIAPPSASPNSYAITVTGTATNLAGVVAVHTTVVQLTVQ